MFGILVIGGIALLATQREPSEIPEFHPITLSLSPTLKSISAHPSKKTPTTAHTGNELGASWHSLTLKTGESLSQLGQRLGFDTHSALAMAQASADLFPVKRMRAGHKIRAKYGSSGQLVALEYAIDAARYLHWQRNSGSSGFDAVIRERPHSVQIRSGFGRIHSSLFQAGHKAGLSDKIIQELTRVFGWEIDFARNLRQGDHFRVLYQEIYRDGHKVRDGTLLAAEFVNQGKSYRAIRFEDANGEIDFYTPEGRSVRRAFLRSPVEFTRISSRFSRRRFHPIKKEWREHTGVDYAAPKGTPIRATGDGRVSFQGRKGGYGRMVVLRHNSRYTTAYAHMSAFADSLQPGKAVEQGETIGYVGESGLATGPHVHYEFRVKGEHRNPLTVELPKAAPLPESQRTAFKQRRHHLLAWLKSVGSSLEWGSHLAQVRPTGGSQR